ncbi:MAG: segregation and condensation protein A [Gemmatimonadota bacterium]
MTAVDLDGIDEAFVVDVAPFSGPLDLLLALIRDEKVDIRDIPISRIADQFLVRIKTLGLDQAADYLEMAGRLLRIKAQMLLPRTDSDDPWEDPRAELVRRLLEYQQMREVVDVLERMAEDRRSRFARSFFPPSSFEPPPAPLALSLAELLSAVDRVMRISLDPDLHDVIPRPLDIDGAMETIRSVLALRERARWRDIVRRGAERWEILSALLALLELARRGELRLSQESPFANVLISRDATGQAA